VKQIGITAIIKSTSITGYLISSILDPDPERQKITHKKKPPNYIPVPYLLTELQLDMHGTEYSVVDPDSHGSALNLVVPGKHKKTI
jgi:hypothetical protein